MPGTWQSGRRKRTLTPTVCTTVVSKALACLEKRAEVPDPGRNVKPPAKERKRSRQIA